jgi:tetratricopeptide (TPR) repeat protein
VLSALQVLEQRALVRREDASDYAFGHVLIRDVAYGQIPRLQRSHRHRLAAEWLEADRERLDERVDAVAHHYASALQFAEASGLDAGDLRERTLVALARAGDRALRLHGYRQALDFFGRAQALGGNWHVHEGLGRSLQTLGRRAEARSAFDEALSLAPEPGIAARLNRLIAGSYTSEYRYDEAEAAFDRAEQALELLPPGAERTREWIDVQIARLTLLYWRQDADRMAALIERARPTIERDGERRQQAEFLASQYMAGIARERFRASACTLDLGRRFLALREELGDPVDIARARFNVGFIHVSRGELVEAQSELEQALATAERTGDATLRSRSLTYLAQVHRRKRDVGRAASLAEHALAAATELGMPEYVGAARATLGWVAWMENDPARAKAEAEAALEAFAGSTFASYPWDWTARFPLLAIALDDGRIAEAVAHARAIIDVRQQALPDGLERALRDAVEERELRSALELAVAEGLL